MAKFLYGANVKAVQQFIFQTNKLNEIIGASELVEQICTKLFIEQVGITFRDANFIVSAAGIVKYVFDDEVKCQDLVRKFPMVVFSSAPGISFSQAVVKMKGDDPSPDELRELETRLKTQRNKVTPPLEVGLRIMERSRRTGLPAIKYDGIEVIDKGTSLKIEAKTDGLGSLSYKLNDGIDGLIFKFPADIKKIASANNYIAIIHADGNNLGKAIRDLNENTDPSDTEDKKSSERNKGFSMAIEEATLAAAKTAVKETFKDIIAQSLTENSKKDIVLPMRPVILGGDDFTLICNAQYALELTAIFLAEFEKEAAKAFKKRNLLLTNSLTACAGIAYVKSNYPFHYGVKLAEDLCSFSKEAAKKKNPNHVPACLSFHRVQSSFVGKYKDLIERELTAIATGLKFCGGPYFILQNEQGLTALMNKVEGLRSMDTPVSKLRAWISTCHFDKNLAVEDLDRLIKILQGKKNQHIIKKLELDDLLKSIMKPKKEGDTITTTLYDAITIYSLNAKK